MRGLIFSTSYFSYSSPYQWNFRRLNSETQQSSLLWKDHFTLTQDSPESKEMEGDRLLLLPGERKKWKRVFLALFLSAAWLAFKKNARVSKKEKTFLQAQLCALTVYSTFECIPVRKRRTLNQRLFFWNQPERKKSLSSSMKMRKVSHWEYPVIPRLHIACWKI